MKKYVNKLKRIVAVMLSAAMVVSLFQWDLLRTFADGEGTSKPMLDFIPEGATLEENKMNEPYPVAYVKNNEVTLYADFAAGAQGAIYTGAQGEQIELANSYTYTAGGKTVVLYKYEYYEFDGVMHTARNDGYMFISADDISFTEVEKPEATATPEPTVSPESTPKPAPDTTPVIPENPTLTEGEDVSIVDAEGNAITEETGLKLKEGTKTSVSVWSILESNSDVAYQWQIRFDKESDLWVDIQGQTGKGMLLSPAMVNSITSPAIRCEVTSGTTVQYSMTIPVTVVKDMALTDNATNVSVSGILPEDVTLTVASTALEDTGLNNGVYPVSTTSLFSDVTLYQGDSTYQPSAGETVTVTFPESAVTGAGFATGDAYQIYHIHDDVVDISGIKQYNGGDIEMTFDSLSVVGISKATAAEQDLVDLHGAITSEETLSEYLTVTFKSDTVTLYDTPYGDVTVYTTTVTGCSGAEVEAWQKITYNDGFIAYRIANTLNTPADLSSTITAYPIVSANDVSEASGDTIVVTKCAICGKENCTTAHLYCEECGKFDCGVTHTQENIAKPITEAVIPENYTIPEGVDVSIADADGNAVTESGFTLQEGTRTSLSAWSILGENVSYQWQIRYDTENDLWTDIQGKTEKGMVISPAMVLSIESPAIRCQITSGETVQYSAEIPVTVEKATVEQNSSVAPAMFSLARTANNVTTYAKTSTLTNYSVVINYVFENNEEVAASYTATLAAGSNFSATVTHPTVMGYLPYIGTAAETSTEIELNITNIQADVTYTVTYKPTNVNYTVIYYKQNLDNDNYTECERETLSGLTNSYVSTTVEDKYSNPELAKEYEGFYALLYEKPAIAADGSTVVEIYYDRNYYLMKFNLGEGGYGVDPIYARYETPVEIGTPTRPGYIFRGWSLDGTTVTTLPVTIPSQNMTYTALWDTGTTAFTVVYWYENANDDGYTSVGSISISNVASGSEVTSATYKDNAFDNRDGEHFTYNAEKAETKTVAGNGSTVLNVYFTRNEYTITFSGVLGELICTSIEHEHSDSCCKRGGTSLSHWWHDDCCILGLSEHTHSDSCYKEIEYSVTKKYDADISDVWTTDPIKSMLDDGYVFQSSVTDKYYSFLEKMPGYDITMTATKWDGNKYTWYYYLEVHPDMDTTGLTTRTDNGKTYYEYDSTMVYGSSLSLTYEEDYYPITGFTQRDSDVPGFSNRVAYLYYVRNSYDMSFINYGTEVTDKGSTYLYGSDISSTNFTPSYPATLEAGAYTFDGWYTSPYFGNTKFDFSNATMPANDLILYAKWVPVKHDVTFYLTRSDYEAGTPKYVETIEVPHDSYTDDVLLAERGEDAVNSIRNENVQNSSYTFIGWFYLEDGEEKMFDPFEMQVKKDLDLYGKWSSNVLKEYTVYFKIQETDIQIAEPITGSALAGITKTFDAKGGTELYVGYQEGYFPLVKSHSMTIDINATEENDTNVFTFEYVRKDAVPYTVYYVTETNPNNGLGTVTLDGTNYYRVAGDYTDEDNRKAVVTEKFKVVSGYMPDAYQKRLVVDGNDSAKNEIVFYYTEDTTHSYYKITHYIQNTDGETWTEYASSQAVGDIGQRYTAAPITIDGFTYMKTEYWVGAAEVTDVTTDGAELTTGGLEIKLYYDRNSYPYKVRYLEQDTGKELSGPEEGTGEYGQVIFERAINIDNYTAVEPTSQTLTIKIEESEAKLNIITFYYVENEAAINYVVVGPEGCGIVKPTSEKVKVLTGTAQGSTATAASNYRFVGWYDNDECTGTALSTAATFVPSKPENGWVDGTTYYAKFELAVADLTITKNVPAASYNEEDTFVFNVDLDGVIGTDLTVIINSSTMEMEDGVYTASVKVKGINVDTPVIVTEDITWSYKYDLTHINGQKANGATSAEVTLTASGGEVTFTNTKKETDKWLKSDAYVENIFTSVSASSNN